MRLREIFRLFLFMDSQIFKMFWKRDVKVNAYAIILPPTC